MGRGVALAVVLALVVCGSAQGAELTNRQETNTMRASYQAGFKFGPPGDVHVKGRVGRCPVRLDGKVRCPILLSWRRNGTHSECKVHVLLGEPGKNYGGYQWGKDARRCLWPLQS